MRVVRRSLTESRRKDVKELRKYSIEISGGISPGGQDSAKEKDSCMLLRQQGGRRGKSRLEGCRLQT